MKIGRHELNSQVFLAPMAGTSDKPFRRICKEQGAGLTTSEMVVIKNHLLKSKKSKYRLDFADEDGPISIQIAGSRPDELAESAKHALNFGANIIDINMGCPAKKVCSKASGSALMQDELLVKDILTSVVNSVDIPITLKMRTGWDAANKNAPKIATIAEEAGIKMLTIHGRTREDKYNGNAEYDTIAEVVRNVDIPVIANGDVNSAEKAKEVIKYTGANGVMVGRAAQGNPWIISEINHYLNTGELAPKIPLNLKKLTILSHISQIHKFYGENMGVRLARKHIFWYAMHLEKSSYLTFWKKINKVNESGLQYSLFKQFLNNNESN
jgi:tRNA-dihydrouridine synthase B